MQPTENNESSKLLHISTRSPLLKVIRSDIIWIGESKSSAIGLIVFIYPSISNSIKERRKEVYDLG